MSLFVRNKSLRLATLCLSLLAVLLFGFSRYENKTPKPSTQGIAVVELFTSQGCSSCPAADKNLSEIIDANSNYQVFALSFHVSYWNHLGWKDPYSKQEFTDRQRQYASVFQNSSIYTPQMIVNGKNEFVGSNKGRSQDAINKALDDDPQHTVTLSVDIVKDKINLEYGVIGKTDQYIINIALVERDLQNSIPRGENKNKTLHHDNVVRHFISEPLSSEGEHKFLIPEGFRLAKGSLVAYVQNKNTLEVTGATQFSLSSWESD